MFRYGTGEVHVREQVRSLQRRKRILEDDERVQVCDLSESVRQQASKVTCDHFRSWAKKPTNDQWLMFYWLTVRDLTESDDVKARAEARVAELVKDMVAGD